MIGLRDVNSSSEAAQRTRVRASIYNCTEADVVLLVRARFAGNDGPTEPASAWRTLILPPRSEAVYSETAVLSATRHIALDVLDGQRAPQPYRPGERYPLLVAPRPAP
ncbi:hypothetical protein DIE06_27840 [Burkholderia sp. Bp8998]|nr:hypothetical protein DIE06_27840 [Burkholderia sp. Bp8998]